MTGANTDRVTTPAFIAASAILLRIASPLFHCVIHATPEGCEPTPSEPNLVAWSTLRFFSELYFANRSTFLTAPQREKMRGSLTFAHDSFHEENELPHGWGVENCACRVAHELRELALVLAEDAEAAAL